MNPDHMIIKRLLESNQPFFVGRIAGIELKMAYLVFKGMSPAEREYREERAGLETNAGIYTKNEESVQTYVQQLMEAYEHCTVIAEWERTSKVFSFTGMGQELVSSRTKHVPNINAIALEPYYVADPHSWMTSLRGKRILIVHPFVETMKRQVAHLDKLFPGREWFRNCMFQFIAPPFTLAGNHQGRDWQEHLRNFYTKLDQCEEFDVALVAGGGYGMIISDYVYTKRNKSVLYIGGALQLFFGIIGKRWFDNKAILSLVNDYWVRPSQADRPPHFTKVEKGCYW
jgi:hypothetical protein